MRLRELDLEELKWLHENELSEAFPPEELKPFAAMEKLCASGLYHPVGAYEGEDLVGYALLWESPGGQYVPWRYASASLPYLSSKRQLRKNFAASRFIS